MKSVKNLFLGTLLTALVFTGCDQGLGVSGGGLPALTGAAAISGTLRVEETLTAETTLNVPVGIENLYHYQWQRKAADEDAAWTNIDEAVSAGYTLAPDDEGKYIQVLVTVTGYGGAVTGSREETVAQGGGGGNGNGNGNGEDQGGSLTADVSYVPTNDETDWDEGAWTGKGTAEEAWGLAVTETPVVYFSVQKTATQTITVGGTDEDLVEMAETGQTWDEATASDTLAVFKVKANKVRNGKFLGGAARESDGKTEADVYDEWYDSTFEGDNFQFTLNVSEPGKDGKTVTVNLKQKVDLSTAAVFIVREDHTLERQTGIKRFADISNAGLNSHKVNFDDSPGTRLIDMLVWVDQNLDNNTEYLVRVVASEEMWPVYITYTREDGEYATLYPSVATGKVRLRGAGSTPRVIKSITGVETNKIPYKYFKYYGQNDGRSLRATLIKSRKRGILVI
jgi:hypothetical protein